MLMWSGSRIFASLDTSLNIIWRVKKTRPYWKQRLLSIGLVPLVLILFMGLLSATSLQNLVEGSVLHRGTAPDALLSNFMRHVAPPLLSWVVLFTMYWLMPARKVLVRSALIGSAVAALLWQAARLGFDIYLRNFDKMDTVYGTATGLVVFILWIYYSAMTLLVGAVVGASDLDRRLSQKARRTVKRGTQKAR
jgi:YihY family inner membrane protein